MRVLKGYTGLVLCVVLLVSCQNRQEAPKQDISVKGDSDRLILGVWERVDQDGPGLIIKVSKVSGENSYIARIVKVPKDRQDVLKPGDIFWQNVRPEGPRQFTGQVLTRKKKGSSLAEAKIITETKSARFVLANDTTVMVNIEGSVRKWVKKG